MRVGDGGRGGLKEDAGEGWLLRPVACWVSSYAGSLGGLMTAKEQLRQVDVMGEEEAVRVLQLLSSQRVGEALMAGSLAGAGVGDETLTVKEGKAKGRVRTGAVVRRRISIDALARELGRFKRQG